MTGRYPNDEEPEHLVIQYDAGAGATESPRDAPGGEEPAAERPGLYQRYRYALFALVALALLATAGYAIGYATYDPPSRLPALVFSTEEPLYGTNQAIAAELNLVREAFSDDAALDLRPTGTVFRLPLPRTVADRLFGRRDEAATIFAASSPAGEFRFLALSEGDEARILAIEAPLGLSALDQPTGIFLALDRADPQFARLITALEATLAAVDELTAVELDAGGYYVFGPYGGADVEALRAQVEGTAVIAHLADAIRAADGDVSLAAPAFLVTGGPSRGTINAVYHPPRRVVMEPLWGETSTASLAHELVHAYMDTVEPDRRETLTHAADYFDDAHPVLYGEVVGDLYERLGREGRAEEALAFLAGAIAAQQTKTVATQRLLANPGNLAISEAVLYSDIGLLLQIGLLPVCMQGTEGLDGEITHAFYESLTTACE